MARSVSPTLSIVIPTRNEARNLEVVLPELPVAHEVILVDGNSVDDTVATARRLMPDIRVLHQTRKGKGNALACGFLAATGDIVVMFDADGSADPAEIPAFVQALVNGADFAKGTRYRRGSDGADGGSEDITPLRDMGNRGLNMISNKLFGTSFTDLCYGYNAFWRDIVPLLDLPSPQLDRALVPETGMVWCDGFEIETVINCRVVAAGLKVAEVASVERPRVYGESNLRTFSDGYRVLRTLASERRRANDLQQVRRARVLTHHAQHYTFALPARLEPVLEPALESVFESEADQR
ncbi:MAG TPA: glycosyltransferase family 2 protein [Pseudonocardiaceae bacterium]|jgi:glycosyltransferase involved in cell wall biosynthesis|nr:glycosyltransferase family 2 protein [Pseudonocardiaceae bacterium]